MTEWAAECVIQGDGSPVQGLVWHNQRVLFTRPRDQTIMAFDPDANSLALHRRHTGGISHLAIGPDGTLYGSQGPSRRIVRLPADGTMWALPYRLDGKIHNFPGDLTIDLDGNIWFCTQDKGMTSPGPSIYPVLPDSAVLMLRRAARGQWILCRATFDATAPRAVTFSPDHRMLYVAQTDQSAAGKRELRAYPVRADSMGDFTVLHTFGADSRGPHPGIASLCLDSDGNILACAGGESSGPGPMVYVFSPEGRVLDAQPVPRSPVGCTFAERDLAILYVSADNGSLFRIGNTGRRGLRSGGPAGEPGRNAPSAAGPGRGPEYPA